MRQKIDCFLPCERMEELEPMIETLRQSKTIQHIHLLVSADFAAANPVPDNCTLVVIDRLQSSGTMLAIEENTSADYVLLNLKASPADLGQYSLDRMLAAAVDSDAQLLYSDHYSMEQGVRVKHPVIDYQLGSVRDDFDFGSLVLIKASALHAYAQSQDHDKEGLSYAGFYDLRLFLSRHGDVFHLNEYLYTEQELDTRKSGEKQFDYVNPRNREVQVEMEQVVTRHLSELGALIDPSNYCLPDFTEQQFDCEASVVIPVFNRVKTIKDAVDSALGQKTRFKYNVIVVDNHSTDGTTELLDAYADPRLIHIVPERTDLGIGGCWNVATGDERCGRFAVQLDSDDLYSSDQTLQRIVDAFYRQKAAMVIGSYRMCDIELNTLPPGLIDHREWTDENGCNNALRINGLGAPRAFFTPLVRQVKFPNTSYGEDYALGLLFSRRYRIGRIFDELYLCRRWGGNSDAALSIEKVNANNLYKDRLRTMEISARRQMLQGKSDLMTDSPVFRFFNRQLETWDLARRNFRDLQNVQTRELPVGDNTLLVQFNPARIVSTGAKIDRKAIASRPCFLCDANRPKEQIAKELDADFKLLVNPYPILPVHFTIPSRRHQPQAILSHYGEIHKLLSLYPELMIFYNGPKCGASAPDHLHLQAGTNGVVPLQRAWQRLSRSQQSVYTLGDEGHIALVKDYVCPLFLIRSLNAKADQRMFNKLYHAMPQAKTDSEPMMNILAWRQGEDYLSVVIPRRKHRPDCYMAEGDDRMMISPGALDMAGLIITPREADFKNLTAAQAESVLKEVAADEAMVNAMVERLKEDVQREGSPAVVTTFGHREPIVSVGIVSGQEIHFDLNRPYTAKGESITGEQVVTLSEGSILWNGNQYRELVFQPQSPDASFSLHDVTIGVNFHWERRETQVFQGTLRLVVEADKICAINELPVEQYLMSVISSEMSATSSLEFLKAHAVISRSWLLAQMEKRRHNHEGTNNFFSFVKKEDTLIKWYDRDDHTIFDVCADDHCQRYQGITKETNAHVVEAVRQTRGQILLLGDEICDARFSKCCGGVSEEFQYCWEDTPKSYLSAIVDAPHAGAMPDLTVEANAERWIRSTPEAFCNTKDNHILSQVLNDFDQETPDFYRWHVDYTQEELRKLICEKTKLDFGDIVDLQPLERGKSGRISLLRIVGTKLTFTIGKELEIRRVLSSSHLYSSAFVVDRHDENAWGVPARFTITGAGWGHGVGLCQIGAAVMGEKGYAYDQILLHYYRGAEIRKIYK